MHTAENEAISAETLTFSVKKPITLYGPISGRNRCLFRYSKQESTMDVSQIASLASGLNNLELNSQVSNLVLKKTLDNQQAAATSLIASIPQMPANPAIGRNINTTA